MTDSDIIEALDCCTGLGCDKCKFNDGDPNTLSCEWELKNAAMEVLKRQQAEIKKLRCKVERLKKYDEERDIRLHAKLIRTARDEAIKDFAERLKVRVKERLYKIMGNKPDTKCVLVGMKEIAEFDELVEEMEGEV